MDSEGHGRMAANSSKSSGREKEVMWKSCSRATKPPLQIKLYGSKEGQERGRQIEGEKELQRENKALWSGTSLLYQTIMHAMGIKGQGRKEHSMGEKETARRQQLKYRKTETINVRQLRGDCRVVRNEQRSGTCLAQIVCLSVGKWNCCGCAWLLQSVSL